MYSSDIRVHFIDTPGYDDANPSVTDILKEMADWMSQPNRANVQFGGNNMLSFDIRIVPDFIYLLML